MSKGKTLTQRVAALEKERRALQETFTAQAADMLHRLADEQRRRIRDEDLRAEIDRLMRGAVVEIYDRLSRQTVRVIIESPDDTVEPT